MPILSPRVGRLAPHGHVLLPMLVLLLMCYITGANTSREYQLKAAFLFNFAQFTQWPPEAFENKDSPLVIGILGSDPFGRFLDETVRGEVVHGRNLVIKRYRRVAEIKTCHILYIGRSESGRIEHMVDNFKGKPILTVTDIEEPPRNGVIIRLMTEKHRIRFEINPEAAKTANLNLSPKLLRAAVNASPETR